MSDIETSICPAGIERKLGCHTGGSTKLKSYASSGAGPMYSMAQIQEIITYKNRTPRRSLFGADWVRQGDQKSHGCHDDKTEVLTEKGWCKWSDYNGSDCLATMNPLTEEMEYQSPIAVQQYEYDGLLHFSNNRGVDFALTPNHRMYIRKWNERARTLDSTYQFRNVDELGWYVGLPSSTSGFRGVKLERISIPGGREYLGNDFVCLLALIASDGWAAGSESECKNQVRFCCFNESRYSKVAELARRIGFHEIPGRSGVWFYTDREFAKWVRANCYTSHELGSENKKIPDILKNVCQSQVELFLDFFGDKNHSVDANEVYYSASRRLIDDLQEILLKVGKRSTIRSRSPRTSTMKDGRKVCGRHPEWTANVWSGNSLSLSTKQHVETESYKGVVYCATVPNGTLITRRNDKVLISGNSCNGFAAASSLSKARYLRGFVDGLVLSGSYVYSKINGGSDNGSSPSDDIDALSTYGAPPVSLVTADMIYPRLQPPNADHEAAQHKGLVMYEANSQIEFYSGIAAGFIGVVALCANNVYSNWTGSGVMPVLRGQMNHANHVDDLVLVNGEIVCDTVNNWNVTWGDNGRALIPWGTFANICGVETPFILIASTEEGGN